MTEPKEVPIQYFGPGPDAVDCGPHLFGRDGDYVPVAGELAQLLLDRGDFRKKGQSKDDARKQAEAAHQKQAEQAEQAEQPSAADQTPTEQPAKTGGEET